MCRLILTTGLCFIIASFASITTATDPSWYNCKFCTGKQNGNYPNTLNPNAFYQCSNGITYNQNCQQGLIYRASCNCCDWPQTQPTAPTGPTGTTATDPSWYNCHFCTGKQDGNYVNSLNPNAFYQCSNGRTFNQDCQQGLIYRASCDCCDWPQPQPTAPPSPTGVPNGYCKGKSAGLYPNPSDPTSFYQCAWDLTYTKYCPAGLIFKASISNCDWPSPNCFCKGKSDGFYPHPTNEVCYYQCSCGETYTVCCPDGYIYKASCNKCELRPTPTPTTRCTTTTTRCTTTTPKTTPTTTRCTTTTPKTTTTTTRCTTPTTKPTIITTRCHKK